MRIFVMSIGAAIIIAILGLYVLDSGVQRTSDQAFSSATNVRFPHEESGHNLVGKDWSSAKEH
jgi:hypothetical protein